MLRLSAVSALAICVFVLRLPSCNAENGNLVPIVGPDDPVVAAVGPSALLKIDGKVDDGEWHESARHEGFFDRDTGATSDAKAEFWIASDSKFVYFAARVITDPRKVVADEYRQGVSLGGNDSMTLVLDTFGIANSANTFGVNAAGATSINLAGGRAAKTEWLGEFEGCGRKTETGWECEARIPWALMSLPGAGKRDMRLNIWWFRADKANTYEWTYAKNDYRNFPIWQGVDVPNIKPDRSIKLLPYAYLGGNDGVGLVSNFGLDAKTSFNETIQVVGTFNPDFRSIENNILSLDFSYFERLAEDPRPFFQEGARFFQTGFDQKLFASQRIKDFDAGINVYGTLNNGTTRLGLMSLSDFGVEQDTVLSLTQKVSPAYDLGFAFVGDSHPGQRNNALQLTNSLKLGDGFAYLNGQFTDDQRSGSGSRLNGGWFGESNGTSAGIEYTQVTPNFFPRLGFSPEQDLKGFNASYGHEYTLNSGPLQAFKYNAFGIYYDKFDGGFYRSEAGFDAAIQTRSGLVVGATVDFSNFEGSSDHVTFLNLRFPYTDPYRNFGIQIAEGMFGGDHYQSAGFSLQYRPIARMQASLATQFVEFGGFERQVIGALRYDIGSFQSVGGRFVNSGDDWNAYGYFRLSGRRGNEYFLILGDPNSKSFQLQILLKVVVPLTIRI